MDENIWQYLAQEGLAMALVWCTKILYAGIALVVGLWALKLLRRLLKKNLGQVMKEEALMGFVISTADVLLKIVLIVAVASLLGIHTASFIAVLGSLGLAIGLALQGSLANFAGGILLIIFKPFKKGDFVTIKGIDGFVSKIDILYTSLNTRLNRVVVIPNSTITSDVLINHSHEEAVRRMFYLSISHNSSIQKAKELFYEAIEKTPHILKDPKPFIEVSDLTDSAVVFRMFIGCKPADYFRVKEPAIENIKYIWEENGIEMPFPHRILHIANDKEGQLDML